MLDRAKDAILAAGVDKDEILPGYSNSLMNYRSVFFNTFNNTRICKDTVTNIVSGQTILRIKRDESRINRTLEAVRSIGSAASIFGYSLSGMKETVDEARKMAFDGAMQTAQDSVISDTIVIVVVSNIVELEGILCQGIFNKRWIYGTMKQSESGRCSPSVWQYDETS